MKLSIVVSIYNSHGVLARQAKYFKRMALPNDVEFVFVDDGSDPPFDIRDYDLPNLSIYATGQKLAWTQGLGRNLGAEKAQGEYLLMTDVDHIISREAINWARGYHGSKAQFKRFFGVLLEDGTLTQDLTTLASYGLDVKHLKPWRGLYASVHMNTFAIRRDIFMELGGYNPRYSLVGYHPVTRSGDDCHFNTKWNHYAVQHDLPTDLGPSIYMFPIGRYHIRGETNPMGLFHNLSYDGVQRMTKGEELAT